MAVRRRPRWLGGLWPLEPISAMCVHADREFSVEQQAARWTELREVGQRAPPGDQVAICSRLTVAR